MTYKTKDLSIYKTSLVIGAGRIKQFSWYAVNTIFFNSFLLPVSSLKVWILKLYGAKIGEGVNIKPRVNIKFPWKLEIGSYTWLGEGVWIDNLAPVKIGNHCCLSQGVYLLTGNHDYKKSSFDLILGSIKLEDGVWIGASAIVCPGVTCKTHSVLAVQSVATKDLDSYTINQGNPAKAIRVRNIE